MKGATTSPEQSFFDMPADALNERGEPQSRRRHKILPSQVFGKRMKDNPDGGSIINISSMNAFRPLTRIPGYNAAKAAVSQFHPWLASTSRKNTAPISASTQSAPGIFLTEQNRFLLTEEKTGDLTARAEPLFGSTPMGRFGSPDDLVGVTLWLPRRLEVRHRHRSTHRRAASARFPACRLTDRNMLACPICCSAEGTAAHTPGGTQVCKHLGVGFQGGRP